MTTEQAGDHGRAVCSHEPPGGVALGELSELTPQAGSPDEVDHSPAASLERRDELLSPASRLAAVLIAVLSIAVVVAAFVLLIPPLPPSEFPTPPWNRA